MMAKVRKQQLKQKQWQHEGSFRGNDVKLQKRGEKKPSTIQVVTDLKFSVAEQASYFCETIIVRKVN